MPTWSVGSRELCEQTTEADGEAPTESNLSLSAPAQRAVRGGIGSFRACQRWAAVGLCCGQSLLSLRGDRRLVQPGLPRRTVPPQSGRSPGRRAGTRRTGSSACRERPDRLSKRPPVVGGLERFSRSWLRLSFQLVVTWRDQIGRLTLGFRSIAGTRGWPSLPGVVCGLRRCLTTSAHHLVDSLRTCWTALLAWGRGSWLSTG
jgi:hypothetical protein